MQLWDTAGQERFRTIASSYYRGADALVLVYDCSCLESLRNIERVWIREIERHPTDELLASGNLMLLGNKADLADTLDAARRAEIKAEAEQIAHRLGASHYECSAQSGEGVHTAFNVLIGSTARSDSFVKKPRLTKQPTVLQAADDAKQERTAWWSSCFQGMANMFRTNATVSA